MGAVEERSHTRAAPARGKRRVLRPVRTARGAGRGGLHEPLWGRVLLQSRQERLWTVEGREPGPRPAGRRVHCDLPGSTRAWPLVQATERWAGVAPQLPAARVRRAPPALERMADQNRPRALDPPSRTDRTTTGHHPSPSPGFRDRHCFPAGPDRGQGLPEASRAALFAYQRAAGLATPDGLASWRPPSGDSRAQHGLLTVRRAGGKPGQAVCGTCRLPRRPGCSGRNAFEEITRAGSVTAGSWGPYERGS